MYIIMQMLSPKPISLLAPIGLVGPIGLVHPIGLVGPRGPMGPIGYQELDDVCPEMSGRRLPPNIGQPFIIYGNFQI